jgi:hypothetical protein
MKLTADPDASDFQFFGFLGPHDEEGKRSRPRQALDDIPEQEPLKAFETPVSGHGHPDIVAPGVAKHLFHGFAENDFALPGDLRAMHELGQLQAAYFPLLVQAASALEFSRGMQGIRGRMDGMKKAQTGLGQAGQRTGPGHDRS